MMGIKITKKQTAKVIGPVMGLDVATTTGVVVLNPTAKVLCQQDLSVGHVKGHSSLETRMLRLKKLQQDLIELLDVYEPKLVVIEGYGYGNINTLATLVEFGTATRATVFNRRNRMSMFEVAPTAVKKFAAGAGNVKKDEMRLAVYKRWKFEHKSDNVVDAYAIARVGLCLSGQVQPANQNERDVIYKIMAGGKNG